SEKRQAADFPVQREEGAGGGEDSAARGLQCHTDEAGAAEDDVSVALRRDANNTATPAIRRCHVKIGVAVKRQTLRPSKPAEESRNIAALRDAVDAVVTRSRWPRDVEVAVRMKCQMIRGERRLNGRKNKNLAARTDFENGSAAVADIKIFCPVKRDSCGDTHAFDPLFRATLGRNAVNRAIVAAGNEKIPRAIQRQTAG